MKTEFKAKFLQHLIESKEEEKGFTLIELLVVIIIIGILAAIALPSFLSQANKAKQSEAKTYVGSCNKGQQAYYTEKSSFTDAVLDLGVGIKSETVNYTYDTTATNSGLDSTALCNSASTTTGAALKNYAGLVSLVVAGSASDATSVAILCEQKVPGEAGTAPDDGETCNAAQSAI